MLHKPMYVASHTHDGFCTDVSQDKLTLTLRPVKAELLKLYGTNGKRACIQHPLVACFHDVVRNLHFELDDTRLEAWSAAIVRTEHICSCKSLTEV